MPREKDSSSFADVATANDQETQTMAHYKRCLYRCFHRVSGFRTLSQPQVPDIVLTMTLAATSSVPQQSPTDPCLQHWSRVYWLHVTWPPVHNVSLCSAISSRISRRSSPNACLSSGSRFSISNPASSACRRLSSAARWLPRFQNATAK